MSVNIPDIFCDKQTITFEVAPREGDLFFNVSLNFLAKCAFDEKQFFWNHFFLIRSKE